MAQDQTARALAIGGISKAKSYTDDCIKSIASGFVFKGKVNTRADLPTSGAVNGQVYYIKTEQKFVTYLNGEWINYSTALVWGAITGDLEDQLDLKAKLDLLALISETGNKIDLELNETDYKLVAKLYDKNNSLLSTSSVIDLPIESVVVSGRYVEDSEGKAIILTLKNGTEIRVPVDGIISGLASKSYVDTQDNLLHSYLTSEATRATNKEEELNTAIGVEKVRAEEAEQVLTLNLAAEGTIRSNADSDLLAKITSEGIRATNREDELEVLINSEGERAIAKETLIETNLANEVTRATTKEDELETAIKTEASNRETADNTLQAHIDSEANIRLSRDNELEVLIDSEANRAIAAEDALSVRVTTEKAERESADTTLQTNIDNEATTRATNDTTLETNLNNEITRATTREDGIDAELEIVQADYLKNADKVELKAYVDSEGQEIRDWADGKFLTEHQDISGKLDILPNVDDPTDPGYGYPYWIPYNFGTEVSSEGVNIKLKTLTLNNKLWKNTFSSPFPVATESTAGIMTKADKIKLESAIQPEDLAVKADITYVDAQDESVKSWVEDGYVPLGELDNYSTTSEMTIAINEHHDDSKQDVISDLDTIREGAELGSTALQSVPDTYRLAADQDVIDATKQKKLIAGTNITIASDGTISAAGSSYSAGAGIKIDEGENPEIALNYDGADFQTGSYNELALNKQNTGLRFVDGTTVKWNDEGLLSCIGGGGGGSVINYVETLPSEGIEGQYYATPNNDDSGRQYQGLFDILHPVNSLYQQLSEYDNPNTMFNVVGLVNSTWEDVSATYDGRALWISNNNDAGTELAGSLPDITGTRQLWVAGWQANQYANGCFTPTDSVDSNNVSAPGGHQNNSGVIYFKASNSNSIYGAAAGANIVRPTSITTKLWKRTA